MIPAKKIPLLVLLSNCSVAFASEFSELVLFSRASEVQIYSDASERGGMTEAEIYDDPNTGSLIFGGVLRGVTTATGQRVGFAGIRVPLGLSPSVRQIDFDLQETRDLTLRVVLRTTKRVAAGVAGELSYQAILAPASAIGMRRGIELNQLVPVVRGRELRRDQAPLFRPEQVESVAIELKLSEQIDGLQPEGGAFSIVFPRLV